MEKQDLAEFYAAPSASPAEDWGEGEPGNDVGALVGRWERRRPVYNAVLTGVVLLFALASHGRPLLDPGFWIVVGPSAIGANLCFCAGPLAEAYLRWLGLRRGDIGVPLYVLGTMFAVVLTIVVLGAYGSGGPGMMID